jgi:hypothetical protein
VTYNVFRKVLVQQLLALLKPRELKVHSLVNTVRGGAVKRLGRVSVESGRVHRAAGHPTRVSCENHMRTKPRQVTPYRGLVGGKDKHKFLGWVAGAVQEGAEGVTSVFRHAAVTVHATLAQERVSLVNEQEETR